MNPTLNSIVDVMMNKTISFPEIKQSTSFGTAKQYNAIVNHIITRWFGVKPGFLKDL